jgi:hypothetical protein
MSEEISASRSHAMVRVAERWCFSMGFVVTPLSPRMSFQPTSAGEA